MNEGHPAPTQAGTPSSGAYSEELEGNHRKRKAKSSDDDRVAGGNDGSLHDMRHKEGDLGRSEYFYRIYP